MRYRLLSALSRLIVPFVCIVLGMFIYSYWQGSPVLWESRRDVLLTRLQNLQRLEVLQAQLLAHQSLSEQKWLLENAFLIVAKAKVIYGVDLAKAEIDAKGTTVKLTLPRVEVLELVMKPSDIELVGIKKSLLTSQARFEDLKQAALEDLQAELSQQARQAELIQQAETNARHYLETLLGSLGFTEITITFTYPAPQP